MKTHPFNFRSTSGGFTLVEILVAISILGLMMIGVSQMMTSAMSATIGSRRHMDADTQARLVLDRMAYDISKITKRADVDYFFQKNVTGTLPGNDQMAFYSEAGGYYPSGTIANNQGTMALTGYQINSNNQLERLSKALVWNGVSSGGASPMVFLPQTIATTWPLVEGSGGTPGTDADFQVIGDQVFRLEYCFLVQNSTTNATYSDTPYLAPNTSITGLQDVVAIVVSIAVLDSESRTSVSNATLTSAGKKLDDISGAAITTLPSTLWKADLLSNNLGLPQKTAGQVRFYQRYCYLNHVQ